MSIPVKKESIVCRKSAIGPGLRNQHMTLLAYFTLFFCGTRN
jgi:hypothetical protein